MKKALLTLSIVSVATLAIATLQVFSVFAAKPTDKPGGGGGGSKTIDYIGNDISYPQCGTKLPSDQAFGIVGVNGGRATTTNECMSEQLIWAHTSTGAPNQKKAQVYLNTANPGMLIDDPRYTVKESWPVDNADNSGAIAPNPHGDCDGTNSLACSWQYGWNGAYESVQERFKPAAASAGVTANPIDYKWWLDVETENSWQYDYDTSAEAYRKSVATLEGMTEYLQSLNVEVGLYSTDYQWGVITGGEVSANSNLNGLDSWLAGSMTLRSAKSKCDWAPLTPGGRVVMTQYVHRNLDYNYSCIG